MLFYVQPFSSHKNMEYVQHIYCLHGILAPVTFDLACPPCAPCARRPEGYPPPLPCIDNCKNNDVLCVCSYIMITKTHSNHVEEMSLEFSRDVFELTCSPKKSLDILNLYHPLFKKNPAKRFNRSPRYQKIFWAFRMSWRPTTVPWSSSVTNAHLHCPTCGWSPGREMSDWCDVVKVAVRI